MAYWVEGAGGALAIAPRPRGGDWLELDIGALRREKVDVLVSLLTPAEELELGLGGERMACEAAGLGFRQFPIEDRGVPGSTGGFLTFVKPLHAEMLKGVRIAAHCRAGIGRSSLLIACLLRLGGYNAERAFEMISSARGLTVPDTLEQITWVNDLPL